MATAAAAHIVPNSDTHIRYYPRTAPAGLSPSEVEDWNKLYYRATSIESFIDSFREPGKPRKYLYSKKVMVAAWNKVYGSQKSGDFNKYHSRYAFRCIQDR
ncbi:hypothetical protein OEA41_006095 [Lepraria neglecta]|uniref:Uncharacterized protein n=1 Tax=Lepraria neglecta TaxID=209136 RepID=A0AAD9Z7C2_9LECA|nr:hypothetical protein OEA41_006095 [Lepraria neglecta]